MGRIRLKTPSISLLLSLALSLCSCTAAHPQWVPYSQDETLVLNPQSPPEWQSTAKFSLTGGVLSSPAAFGQLLREDVYSSLSPQEWADKNRRQFFKEMQDLFNDMAAMKAEYSWAESPRELYQEYTLSPVDTLPGLFALQQLWSAYEGGAHPNHSESYHLYMVDPVKKLTLEDILDRKKEPRVLEVVTAALETSLAEYGYGSLEEILLVESLPWPEDALPTAQGLLIQWDPYEIAPYAFGSLEVLIPWKELEEVLHPKFRNFLQNKL